MTQPAQLDLKSECYRCGYNLHGIADDQACPECGLLAQRSRRITDELHNTRPRWLRNISLGTDFILLAIMITLIWLFLQPTFTDQDYSRYISPAEWPWLLSGRSMLAYAGFNIARYS